MKQSRAYRAEPCLVEPTKPFLLLALFFLFLTPVSHAQESGGAERYPIRGHVLSADDNQPLPGVAVQLKDSRTGVNTDANGNFTLASPAREVTISLSYIGYQRLDTALQLPLEDPLLIKLNRDVAQLDEVVVNAGYYETTKRLSTGNISQVTAETISQQPVSNPLAALQGRVPGLEITQQTGVPGGGFTVRLRGQNSIANGNDPLYIINGVPFYSEPLSSNVVSATMIGFAGASPLNAINPRDILSIEVLKDADATAIYGSRGANGVILITTKEGSSGPTKVNFNAYAGIARVGNRVDLLSREQYLQMRHEAFTNDGITPIEVTAPDVLLWDTTRFTDWQKELIGGSANTYDARLSVSGGSSQTQFLFGAGFHRETTVFPGDYANRKISLNWKTDHTAFNDRLKITLTAIYSRLRNNLFGRDLTVDALRLPPVAPAIYDENGKLNWENSTWINPLGYQQQEYWSTSGNLNSNLTLGYKILPDLSFKVSAGYTESRMGSGKAVPLNAYRPSDRSRRQNNTNFYDSSFRNWIVEPQLNWQTDIATGRFRVLLGATLLEQETTSLGHRASGYTEESLMKSISRAPSIIVTSDTYGQYSYAALYGRINYSLLDRYVINLTGRRDGSSRFAPDRRYANFGALGLAWIFSKEPWIRNGWLSWGKLRASYGLTGNDQLGNYLFLDNFGSGGIYQGKRGLGPNRLFNPALEWEANRKLEAGLELGFAGDRFLLAVSYYRNRSSNQLVDYPLPPNTGFTNIQMNLPATIQNTGVEVEINTVNIKSNHTYWSTGVNFSIPRNSLLAFPNLAGSSYANTYVIGQPLDISKRYKYLGVDSQTGVDQFEDSNGDGIINTADRQIVKFLGIKYQGGIHNTLRFKNLSLGVFLQFVKQMGNRYLPALSPGLEANFPEFVMNRWRQPGDREPMQKFTASYAAQIAYRRLQSSDYGVSDASFIRLKNVSCTYKLPQSVSQKIGAEVAHIYVQGQNLLTFTPYRGLDPELQAPTVLPPLSVFTAGLNVTF